MLHCVTCVTAFCEQSLFLVPPDSAGHVSIHVHGYAQASKATQHSTLKKWIDSATWKPDPGGLMSDNEYLTNMRGFEDRNDA
jgi:hypothetical protein